LGALSQTVTTRSSCPYGSGRNSTPFTTLKMAVLAAMPMANVTITTTVKPGFLIMARALAHTAWDRPVPPGDRRIILAAWKFETGPGDH
jgi:hypothetical protein